MQPLAHSHTSRVRGRIGRVKARKLVGSEKGSFIGKAKAIQTSKAKQGFNYCF